MGMSASQARFLSLTARKTNVEYEGQQINQQRTALSNESSNYYSQLTAMKVPTPPSSADYTKITYTFQDGNEKNTVTSLIAKANGLFKVNYTMETPCDAMVTNGTNIITKRTGDETGYYIGTSKLRYASARTAADIASDQYLKTLNEDQLKEVFALEDQYLGMLNNKYPQPEGCSWYVRYQKNSSNVYEPVFYNQRELDTADYSEKTGASLSGIKCYVYGSSVETKEIKNATARVEQDTTGRYISIMIYDDKDDDGSGSYTKYDLTTTTESDDAGYNDAMNQYYYDKAQYDQKIQEVNSKIEIIQIQDKNLELKLKQLDTEENAISTEIDAVKKVISKNVESSFKTFNA